MSTNEPVSPRRRPKALLIAIAAIVVLLVGGLVWMLVDQPDEARQDADLACELIDELPDELTADDLADDPRPTMRLAAAFSLAMAAEEGDDEYADLLDAINQARRQLAGEFKLTDEYAEPMRSACDDL